jgi:hypothetical protein
MQPAPQRAQGRTPETGALCTHSQWIGLFYIRSLTVLYLILVAILMWSVRLVGHFLFLSFHLARGRLCLLLGYKPSYTFVFILFHSN